MYLSWDKKNITDFSEETINTMYDRGFVFTRPKEGAMEQTRSMRVDLEEFKLSSENRRILRKTKDIELSLWPLPCTVYTWEIGKLGKDFYEKKFGDGTFSANKVKELMTGGRKDFNCVLTYASLRAERSNLQEDKPIMKGSDSVDRHALRARDDIMGYCIAVETNEMMHYSYPFYNIETAPKNMGMGMMLKALVYAKAQGKKYLYLGSAQRPTDTYKLQFNGIEWFDGEIWVNNPVELKKELEQI